MNKKLNIPHKFLSNLKIKGKKPDYLFQENYFLLEEKDKILYVDISFDPIIISSLINKNLKSESPQLKLNINNLKNIITKRIKRGNLKLLNLNTKKEEVLKDLKSISKLHFFYNGCSPCELKSLIEKVKMGKIIRNEREIILFSFIASQSELESVLEEQSMFLPIYLDHLDEFNLGFYISSSRNNPLIIDVERIWEF